MSTSPEVATPQRAVRAVATMALAALALAAAATAPAGATGAAPDDTSAAYRCDPGLPVSHEDACDAAHALPDIDEIVNGARDYAGTRWAGAWIDRAGGGAALKLAVTNLTRADRAYLATLAPGRNDVQAVDALFTLLELTAVSEFLTVTLASDRHDTHVDANEAAGVVTVDVLDGRADKARRSVPGLLRATNDPGVKSALARLDRSGIPISTLVRVGARRAAPLADSRTTYPLHNGGLSLVLRDIDTGATSGCTSGYTVVSDNGTLMGLTAGHCATGYLADNISIGGDHLSRSGQNSYLGVSPRPADSMRYSLASASHANDNIFVNGTSREYRDVNGPSYTQTNLYTGTKVCFQGVVSDNNNCDYVEATDVTITTVSATGVLKQIQNMWSISYPVHRGDSGGPVYHVRDDGTAMPAGIVTAGDSTVTWFNHIRAATGTVDVSLYLR